MLTICSLCSKIHFVVSDKYSQIQNVRLAQLDRAFGYGPKGRGFESSNARYGERLETLKNQWFPAFFVFVNLNSNLWLPVTRKIWVKSAGKCLLHDTQTFLRSQWIVYIPQCCCGVAVAKAGTNLIKRKTSSIQATCISLSQLVAAFYISLDRLTLIRVAGIQDSFMWQFQEQSL